MDFGFSAEEIAFRSTVKEYFDREVSSELVAELELGQGPGPLTRTLFNKMGQRGWLTPTWPRRYGGIEGSNIQRQILADELSYHLVDVAHVGATKVGPVILMFGTDEMKEEYLSKIATDAIEFALGYTEPEAGSDLAGLQMRAVDDGDYFTVTGQKIFNTAAHRADYHWLAVRTDPDLSKHKGVSLLIVDLKSPGITIGGLWTLSGFRTNVVYYENVRVPKVNLVGQRGRGFSQIATALDFERVFSMGDMVRHYDDLVAYVREDARDGKPLSQDPLVRQRLGEIAVELQASRLMSYYVAWLMDKGTVPNREASILKLYLTESRQRFSRRVSEILGPLSLLKQESKRSVLNGRPPQWYLGSFPYTIGGGTSEIQRNIIAQRGLGLPRA